MWQSQHMENVTGPDFHPDFIHAFNAYSPKGRNKSFLGIFKAKIKLRIDAIVKCQNLLSNTLRAAGF